MPLRSGLLLLAFALCAPLAFAQGQPTGKMLSSKDVSDKKLKKVVKVVSAAQMSLRDEQMKMKKEMMKMQKGMADKDSSEKAEAKREMRKKQMAFNKKMQKEIQAQAKKEGLESGYVMKVLRSVRQDQELGKRFKKAFKQQMMKNQKGAQEMKKKGDEGGGSSGQ